MTKRKPPDHALRRALIDCLDLFYKIIDDKDVTRLRLTATEGMRLCNSALEKDKESPMGPFEKRAHQIIVKSKPEFYDDAHGEETIAEIAQALRQQAADSYDDAACVAGLSDINVRGVSTLAAKTIRNQIHARKRKVLGEGGKTP